MKKVFDEVSDDLAQKIWNVVEVDDQKKTEAVRILREWLDNQPHLPKDMDDATLERRMGYCKGSIQRTKDSIDMYYTLRNLIPELMCNRDPKADWFQLQVVMGAIIPMPKLTEDYKRVVIFRNLNNDPNKFSALEQIRILFMISDLRYRYDLTVGDIYVVDLEGVTPAILAKFTPPLLRKAELICMKAMNARIAGIHLVNAPSYVDTLVSLLKRVISKEKIRERIHVHSKGMDSLHEFVDKKILPEEYDGTAGPLKKYWDGWKELLMEHRGWFVDQDSKKADESRRPTTSRGGTDFFGFEGSFRQLTLD